MTEKTQKTLAELSVADAAGVSALFAEVRAAFDRAATAATNEAAWKTFRDAWLGRKSGRGFYKY